MQTLPNFKLIRLAGRCKVDEQAKSRSADHIAATPIVVGLGANLPQSDGTPPRVTCTAALAALRSSGVAVVTCSRWYLTAPIPAGEMPPFVNAVAVVATDLAPDALLSLLHRIEARYERRRPYPNAPRTLDLDLLIFGSQVSRPEDPVQLPHPRLSERAFVLEPLRDVLPGWQHPVSGLSVLEMLSRLGRNQYVEPLP